MPKLGEPIKGMSKEGRSTILEKADVETYHDKHRDIDVARKRPRRRRNKTRRRS